MTCFEKVWNPKDLNLTLPPRNYILLTKLRRPRKLSNLFSSRSCQNKIQKYTNNPQKKPPIKLTLNKEKV